MNTESIGYKKSEYKRCICKEYAPLSKEDICSTRKERKNAQKRFLFLRLRFTLYRSFAIPPLTIRCRLTLRHKIKNKRVTKKAERGFFLFSNYPSRAAEFLIPSVSFSKKRVYTISEFDENSSISSPPFKRIQGIISLPKDKDNLRLYKDAIEKELLNGSVAVIYSKKQIKPHGNDKFLFSNDYMQLPVDFNEPIFTLTTTYQKGAKRKKPRAISYIDGPFYADTSIPYKNRADELSERIQEMIRQRTLLSDCEFNYDIKSTSNFKGEHHQ